MNKFWKWYHTFNVSKNFIVNETLKFLFMFGVLMSPMWVFAFTIETHKIIGLISGAIMILELLSKMIWEIRNDLNHETDNTKYDE